MSTEYTPLVVLGCSVVLHSQWEGSTGDELLNLGFWDNSEEQGEIPFDPGSVGPPTVTLQWVSPLEHRSHPWPQTGNANSMHMASSASTACLLLQYKEPQLLGVELMTTSDSYSVLVVCQLNPRHLEGYTQLPKYPLLHYNSAGLAGVSPCFIQFRSACA